MLPRSRWAYFFILIPFNIRISHSVLSFLTKFTGLLKSSISLALLLHFENLFSELLMGHRIYRVFRIFVLDLINDLVLVGWGD